MSDGNSIVAFYSGAAPDDRDRYLSELQTWSDDALESYHDFIQWMFPLRERSGVNPSAPTLDDATIKEFRSRPELREQLRVSFRRMLRFYGFEMKPQSLKVVKRADFQENSDNWLSPWNHNYLRITRILKSLSLLGLEEEAGAFFAALYEVYHSQGANPTISKETFRYWEATVSRVKSAGQ